MLSDIESAAASPGVLVMPPVRVPSRSSIETLKQKMPISEAAMSGTMVMAAPTRNISQPLSWKVATRFCPADVPTSARKSSRPICLMSWFAEPESVQSMGPVLPMALSTSAVSSTPPVSPGEKLTPPGKVMLSLPTSTPSTIPSRCRKAPWHCCRRDWTRP